MGIDTRKEKRLPPPAEAGGFRRIISMNTEIDIQNRGDYPLDADTLIQAIQAVLLQENAAPSSAVSVVITDDAEIATLNQQFRDVDGPTDVLSFPAEPLPAAIAEAQEERYLGDLVIAFPYARAQAEREGHNLNASLTLLAVHGTLHLLGYDHDEPERKAAMWAAQAQALQTLNIAIDIVPEG